MNTTTISRITSQIKTAQTIVPTPQRFYSLDALRAFALLLGVFFHSLMAYVLPPGIWAVGTSKAPTLLLWFVYYSHCFRMETFFLLAGFFARLVVEKRGVSSFLRDRARRILLVFVVALYPMKFLLSCAWVSGGLKAGWLKLPEEFAKLPVWRLSLGGLVMESWPKINLTHLWFLYYLGCISGLFIAGRWLVLRFAGSTFLVKTVDAGFRGVFLRWFAPVCLGLSVTPVLAMMSGPDVDTPDRSLAWNYPVLLLYSLFFIMGWWLHRQVNLLGALARRWKLYLALSLGVSVMASAAVGLRLSGATSALALATTLRWASSLGTGLTMSFAVLGWVGLFVQVFDRPRAWVRYLADSSYWIYLSHLPVVVALQVMLSGWEVPVWTKLLVLNAVTVLFLLTIYHLCIRFTWVGAWLSGRRTEHRMGAKKQCWSSLLRNSSCQ